MEKFECDVCGVYYYTEDRDEFFCPNCDYLENEKLTN